MPLSFSFSPTFSRPPNKSLMLKLTKFSVWVRHFLGCNYDYSQFWVFFLGEFQIVGTSKNFQKKRKQMAVMASDSEDSYSSSSSHGRSNNKVQSFTPSTPPPTSVNYRTAKRRKGIPHRAPMGGLIIEY